MTEAQALERRRWIALALLASAQFVVVLDASIVNVALPTIGEALSFSQSNLAWVVNAYVLTFGGFLLLGGRMADLLGRRRVFMGGLVLFALRLARGRAGGDRGAADRRPRRSGPRRRDPLAGRAVDRHDHVPRRRRAQQGARRLGRGRRQRWRRRRAARRRADRLPRMGVGPLGQRADRNRGRRAGADADRGEPLDLGDAALRLRRRGDDHRRPVDPRLRAGRRERRRLEVDADARAARRLRGADRGLHRGRAALEVAAGARSGSSASGR